MSSTQLLAIGNRGSLNQIKASWLKFNNENGYQFHIAYNIKPNERRKERFHAVCYTAPRVKWEECNGCKAHIKAIGDTREDMTITELNMTHTCGREQSSRKRNYRMADIVCASDVLELYEPTQKREGNAKQFIQMTKKVTGVTVKTGQAQLAVKGKRHDSLEAQMGQYFWIPSLI